MPFLGAPKSPVLSGGPSMPSPVAPQPTPVGQVSGSLPTPSSGMPAASPPPVLKTGGSLANPSGLGGNPSGVMPQQNYNPWQDQYGRQPQQWSSPSSWNQGQNQQGNYQAPTQQAQPQQPQGPNMENTVLSGGNAQQIQNFMQALNKVGAGSNNTFMNNPGSTPGDIQNPGNIVNTNQLNQNNGSGSNYSYTGGFMSGNGNANGQNSLIPRSVSNGIGPEMGRAPGYNAGGMSSGMQSNFDPSMFGNVAASGMTPQLSGNRPMPQAFSPSNFQGGQMSPGAYGPSTFQGGQMSPGAYGPSTFSPQPMSPGAYSPSSFAGGVPSMMANGVPSMASMRGAPMSGSVPSYLSNFSLMSDEEVKQNIDTADPQVRNFLDTINAHSYEYKDKKHGEGRYISPMAQELLKTEAGKSAVIPTPDGLAVDYARLLGIYGASLSHLNKRLNKLEKK